MMLPSRRPGHRATVGAVGAVALAGAMLLGGAAAANAEPPAPPNERPTPPIDEPPAPTRKPPTCGGSAQE